MGVVALVDPDLFRMFGDGYRVRVVRQSLQLRAGRRLRHGYRSAQHLPVDPGRNVRLHVRHPADDHRHARLRRAVRHPHGAGGALHAGIHERPHAAGLSRCRGRGVARPLAAAGRPARSVERPAADVRDRCRGDRRRTGHRRAAAGHYGRHRHRGDAVAEICRDQVLDGHLPGRRLCRAVGPRGHRLRTGNRRRRPQGVDADALFAHHDLHHFAGDRLHAQRRLVRQVAVHYQQPAREPQALHHRGSGPQRDLHQGQGHVHRCAARHDLPGGEPQGGASGAAPDPRDRSAGLRGRDGCLRDLRRGLQAVPRQELDTGGIQEGI